MQAIHMHEATFPLPLQLLKKPMPKIYNVDYEVYMEF